MKTAQFLIAAVVGFASLSVMANTYKVDVTEEGFEPDSIKTAVDEEVTLEVTRKTNSTCATEIVIFSKEIREALPLDQTVVIELGKLAKGNVRFACGMGMVTGVVITE
jgi:plastocyanin domain-containing protein